MTTTRPFRFGVHASKPYTAVQWRELARKVEDLGFSTLLVDDHFGQQLAPFAALGAAAEATTRLRLGTLVLDNDYRHPAVCAKELATVDLLSEGRLEIGLGAGWLQADYDHTGIPYDRPGIRIDRLIEAVEIIKGLFADGPFTFNGKHYAITALDAHPKPIQTPRPPLLIGGGGPRVLAYAASNADIVGINPSLHTGAVDATTTADMTAAAYDRKVDIVRNAAGTRFSRLELTTLVAVVAPTDRRDTFADNAAPMFGMPPAEVLQAPLALIGTIDQMCHDLELRRERFGISYPVVQADAIDAIAPIVARLNGN
jgi:probable F420-dependent oxidoreductase